MKSQSDSTRQSNANNFNSVHSRSQPSENRQTETFDRRWTTGTPSKQSSTYTGKSGRPPSPASVLSTLTPANQFNVNPTYQFRTDRSITSGNGIIPDKQVPSGGGGYSFLTPMSFQHSAIHKEENILHPTNNLTLSSSSLQNGIALSSGMNSSYTSPPGRSLQVSSPSLFPRPSVNPSSVVGIVSPAASNQREQPVRDDSWRVQHVQSPRAVSPYLHDTFDNNTDVFNNINNNNYSNNNISLLSPGPVYVGNSKFLAYSLNSPSNTSTSLMSPRGIPDVTSPGWIVPKESAPPRWKRMTECEQLDHGYDRPSTGRQGDSLTMRAVNENNNNNSIHCGSNIHGVLTAERNEAAVEWRDPSAFTGNRRIDLPMQNVNPYKSNINCVDPKTYTSDINNNNNNFVNRNNSSVGHDRRRSPIRLAEFEHGLSALSSSIFSPGQSTLPSSSSTAATCTTPSTGVQNLSKFKTGPILASLQDGDGSRMPPNKTQCTVSRQQETVDSLIYQNVIAEGQRIAGTRLQEMTSRGTQNVPLDSKKIPYASQDSHQITDRQTRDRYRVAGIDQNTPSSISNFRSLLTRMSGSGGSKVYNLSASGIPDRPKNEKNKNNKNYNSLEESGPLTHQSRVPDRSEKSAVYLDEKLRNEFSVESKSSEKDKFVKNESTETPKGRLVPKLKLDSLFGFWKGPNDKTSARGEQSVSQSARETSNSKTQNFTMKNDMCNNTGVTESSTFRPSVKNPSVDNSSAGPSRPSDPLDSQMSKSRTARAQKSKPDPKTERCAESIGLTTSRFRQRLESKTSSNTGTLLGTSVPGGRDKTREGHNTYDSRATGKNSGTRFQDLGKLDNRGSDNKRFSQLGTMRISGNKIDESRKDGSVSSNSLSMHLQDKGQQIDNIGYSKRRQINDSRDNKTGTKFSIPAGSPGDSVPNSFINYKNQFDSSDVRSLQSSSINFNPTTLSVAPPFTERSLQSSNASTVKDYYFPSANRMDIRFQPNRKHADVDKYRPNDLIQKKMDRPDPTTGFQSARGLPQKETGDEVSGLLRFHRTNRGVDSATGNNLEGRKFTPAASMQNGTTRKYTNRPSVLLDPEDPNSKFVSLSSLIMNSSGANTCRDMGMKPSLGRDNIRFIADDRLDINSNGFSSNDNIQGWVTSRNRIGIDVLSNGAQSYPVKMQSSKINMLRNTVGYVPSPSVSTTHGQPVSSANTNDDKNNNISKNPPVSSSVKKNVKNISEAELSSRPSDLKTSAGQQPGFISSPEVEIKKSNFRLVRDTADSHNDRIIETTVSSTADSPNGIGYEVLRIDGSETTQKKHPDKLIRPKELNDDKTRKEISLSPLIEDKENDNDDDQNEILKDKIDKDKLMDVPLDSLSKSLGNLSLIHGTNCLNKESSNKSNKENKSIKEHGISCLNESKGKETTTDDINNNNNKIEKNIKNNKPSSNSKSRISHQHVGNKGPREHSCTRTKNGDGSSIRKLKNKRNKIDQIQLTSSLLLKEVIPKRTFEMSDFDTVAMIGQGGYAIVRVVKHRGSQMVFALKQIAKGDFKDLSQLHMLANELEIFSSAERLQRTRKDKPQLSDCPLPDKQWLTEMIWSTGIEFFPRFYGCWQDTSFMYFLMEYLPGGDLMKHLIDREIFPEHTAKFYVAQLAVALGFMHNRLRFVHRDVKPDNILFDIRGHTRLVDFGLSRYIAPRNSTSDRTIGNPRLPSGAQTHREWSSNKQSCNLKDCKQETNMQLSNPPTTCRRTLPSNFNAYHERFYSAVGTPDYMAPEVHRNGVAHDRSVDWWSLGVIMYEMLFGGPPLSDLQHRPEVTAKIVQNWKSFLTSWPSQPAVSRDAKDLLSKLICERCERLSSAEEILSHPWFSDLNLKNSFFNQKDEVPSIEKLFQTAPIRPKISGGDCDVSNFDSFSYSKLQKWEDDKIALCASVIETGGRCPWLKKGINELFNGNSKSLPKYLQTLLAPPRDNPDPRVNMNTFIQFPAFCTAFDYKPDEDEDCVSIDSLPINNNSKTRSYQISRQPLSSRQHDSRQDKIVADYPDAKLIARQITDPQDKSQFSKSKQQDIKLVKNRKLIENNIKIIDECNRKLGPESNTETFSQYSSKTSRAVLQSGLQSGTQSTSSRDADRVNKKISNETQNNIGKISKKIKNNDSPVASGITPSQNSFGLLKPRAEKKGWKLKTEQLDSMGLDPKTDSTVAE